MSELAIVDVPTSGGNPMLNLPAGAKTKRTGDVVRIDFRGKFVWLHILKTTPTRWIAIMSAPSRAFKWFEGRLGADIYPLTWEFWQSQKTQLEALGLVGEMVDGVEVLRVPHAICGRSPFIRPPEGA